MKTFARKKVAGSKLWSIWEKSAEINGDKFSLQYLSMNRVDKSVMVLPISKEKKIVFVKKFCIPEEKWETVLPGGKIQNNLTAINTAKKELLEETGYESRSLLSAGPLKILPAYLDAKTVCFIATNLSKINGNTLDRSEHLKIVELGFGQALLKIKNGTIRDARTVALILYYFTFVHARGK